MQNKYNALLEAVGRKPESLEEVHPQGVPADKIPAFVKKAANEVRNAIGGKLDKVERSGADFKIFMKRPGDGLHMNVFQMKKLVAAGIEGVGTAPGGIYFTIKG